MNSFEFTDKEVFMLANGILKSIDALTEAKMTASHYDIDTSGIENEIHAQQSLLNKVLKQNA